MNSFNIEIFRQANACKESILQRTNHGYSDLLLKKRVKRVILFPIAPLLLLMIFFSSCKDLLSVDNYFSDELKLDSVFAQTRYVEAYMWGAAGLFPDEGNLLQNQHTPGPLATDEAFTSFFTSHNYNGSF